jgi:hypothetical protein
MCSRFERAHLQAVTARIARARKTRRGRPPTWFEAQAGERLRRAARRWVEHLERARSTHAHVFAIFPAVGEVAGYLQPEIHRQRQARPRLLAAAAIFALSGWNPEERDAKSRLRVRTMVNRWLPERKRFGRVLSWRLQPGVSSLPHGEVQFDGREHVTGVYELRKGKRVRLRLTDHDLRAVP